MDGLNKKFKDDPVAFLKTTPILPSQDFMKRTQEAGVVDIDFSTHTFHKNCVYMNFMLDRKKASSFGTKPVSAYWLPWSSRAVTESQMGDAADYFFTTQLGGCQLRIVPGPVRFGRTNQPKVMHIAGDSFNPGDPSGSLWRNAQAAKLLPSSELGLSRVLSTSPAPIPGIGRFQYNGEGTNVVGFVRLFKWQFWAQEMDFDGKVPAVRRVWQIL